MTTYLCPVCGAPLPQGNTLCPGCGTPLTTQKKTPVVWRVFRCIFSILLMPFLILSLIATVTLYAGRHAISESTIHAMIESVDVMEMEITDEEGAPITVEDALYDAYESACVTVGMEVPLTRDEMSEVLERSTVDEFLANKMSSLADALLSGTGDSSVTTEEILSLMKENEALIAEVSGGFVMTEEQYSAVADAMEEMEITEALDVSALREEMDLPREVQQLFSPTLLLIAIGVCLFWCGLLALFNLFSRFLVLLYTGIGCILAGAVCALTLALESVALSILRAEADLPMAVIAPVVEKLLAGFWVPGLCLIGLGILLLAGFTVLRIVRRKQA